MPHRLDGERASEARQIRKKQTEKGDEGEGGGCERTYDHVDAESTYSANNLIISEHLAGDTWDTYREEEKKRRFKGIEVSQR